MNGTNVTLACGFADTHSLLVDNVRVSLMGLRVTRCPHWRVSGEGALVVTRCVFEHLTGESGGVFALSGCASLRAENATFWHNTAASEGGVLHADSFRRVEFTHSRFSLNTARSGGVLAVQLPGAASSVSLTHCSFLHNTAHAGSGGAILAELRKDARFSAPPPSLLAITASSFEGNNADADGGALALERVPFAIAESRFVANRARTAGGALAMRPAQATDAPIAASVCGSAFRTNTCPGNGGALALRGCNATLAGMRFEANRAGQGAAIYLGPRAHVRALAVEWADNEAIVSGGAVHMEPNGSIALDTCVFRRNRCASAGQHEYWATGGAIAGLSARLCITRSRFEGNIANAFQGALGAGGAIAMGQLGATRPHVEIADTLFVGNFAAEEVGLGGALAILTWALPSRPGGDSDSGNNNSSEQARGEDAIHALLRILRSSPFAASTPPRAPSLVLRNTTFRGNYASALSGKGGALFTAVDHATVTHCRFDANTAASDGTGEGGAVFFAPTAAWGRLSIVASRFTQNIGTLRGASASGGALALYAGHTMIANASFTSNHASRIGAGSGGALSIRQCARVDLADTALLANTAGYHSGFGGAAFMSGANASLCIRRGCSFATNVASVQGHGSGGALYIGPSARGAWIEGASFLGNADSRRSAVGIGGALFADMSPVHCRNTTFVSNSANLGGAAFFLACRLSLQRCNFFQNHADSQGGAIYLRETQTRDAGSRFYDNTAGRDGGAVYLLECPVLISHAAWFVHNHANYLGGALSALRVSHALLSRAVLLSNGLRTSEGRGGAVFLQDAVECRLGDTFFARNLVSLLGGGVNGGGGALAATGSTRLYCRNTTFWRNHAMTGGGVKLFQMPAPGAQPRVRAEMELCRFSRNTAGFGGGYLGTDGTQAHFRRCVFADNRLRFDTAMLFPRLRLRGGGLALRLSRAPRPATGPLLTLAETCVSGNSFGGIAVLATAALRRHSEWVTVRIANHSRLAANHFLSPKLRVPPRAVRAWQASLFVEGTTVELDSTSRIEAFRGSPWVFCEAEFGGRAHQQRCNASTSGPLLLCGLPPPDNLTLAHPSVSAPAQLIATVNGPPLVPFRPACRARFQPPLKDPTNRYTNANASQYRYGKAFLFANHTICRFDALLTSPGTVELALSSDGRHWSAPLVLHVGDPHLVGFIMALTSAGVIGALLALGAYFLARWIRLRRATRLELLSWRAASVDFTALKILERVGNGQSGEVFRARLHGTEVAVKRLYSELEGITLELFRKEVSIMRTLRCPHVVLFIGATTAHPPHLIITEYMRRGSLFGLLRRHFPELSFTRRLSFALDAARGMCFLHSLSPPIIHRDLKSLNLLVDDDWRVKISDFGMSRFHDAAATMTALGTPAWSAPEVIRGQRYTLSADVFSFAVILWELVTGEAPFAEETPLQAILFVTSGNRLPIPASCPTFLRTLITQCWAEDPVTRPGFADIVAYLEEHLGPVHEPALPDDLSSEFSTNAAAHRHRDGDGHRNGARGTAASPSASLPVLALPRVPVAPRPSSTRLSERIRAWRRSVRRDDPLRLPLLGEAHQAPPGSPS